MLNISSFFEKFKIIDGGRTGKILEVIKVVSLYTRVTLVPEEITINNNKEMRITVSPGRRNEIFMHRSEILSDLLEKGIDISALR